MEGNFLWLYDSDKRLLIKVYRSPNFLYKLTIEIAEPVWLWHARMGRVNFKSFKTMVDKEMVLGMPKIVRS